MAQRSGCCGASLPCVELPCFTGEAGELLLLEIGGRATGFLWQRPAAVSTGGLYAQLQAISVLHPGLVCLGDWNDEPGDNLLAVQGSVVAAAANAVGEYLPTQLVLVAKGLSTTCCRKGH